MGVVTWSDSANKHGVPREDTAHVMVNAYYVEAGFDVPRTPEGLAPTLFIGPPRQLGGPLLEVMAEVRPPRTVHVFHSMPARPKYLARMENDQ